MSSVDSWSRGAVSGRLSEKSVTQVEVGVPRVSGCQGFQRAADILSCSEKSVTQVEAAGCQGFQGAKGFREHQIFCLVVRKLSLR